jgi:hypothetical protein
MPRNRMSRARFLLVFVALGWPAVAAGQWRADVQVDPITDARTRYATVTGSGGDARVAGEPYLAVQCEFLPRLEFESTGTIFNTAGDPIFVDIAVDENEPISVRFVANGDGTGGATTRDDVLRRLLPQMRAGRRVAFRARDFRDVAYDYSFTLAGFTGATSRLECLRELTPSLPDARARIVGHLLSKFWYRVDDPCWQTRIVEPARVFFTSLAEARAAGYDRPGPPCQPGREP